MLTKISRSNWHRQATERSDHLGEIGLSSTERGKHAELLAATALLANGYSVMEPISPQPYDLAIRHPQTGETSYVQIKTAFSRNEERYGGEYIVVRGAKNSGKVYTREEVDYFVAVWQGEVYLFPNREIKEYWIRPDKLSEKWTKMDCGI